MNVIEDIRQVVQDLLAPDLKAIDAKLIALDGSIKSGFIAAEQIALARHNLVLLQIENAKSVADSRHASIMSALDIDRRVAKLEMRPSGFAR